MLYNGTIIHVLEEIDMLYNGVVSHNGTIIHVLEEIEICCTMEWCRTME